MHKPVIQKLLLNQYTNTAIDTHQLYCFFSPVFWELPVFPAPEGRRCSVPEELLVDPKQPPMIADGTAQRAVEGSECIKRDTGRTSLSNVAERTVTTCLEMVYENRPPMISYSSTTVEGNQRQSSLVRANALSIANAKTLNFKRSCSTLTCCDAVHDILRAAGGCTDLHGVVIAPRPQFCALHWVAIPITRA